MYVCMYVCIYAYIYIYTCTYIYIYVSKRSISSSASFISCKPRLFGIAVCYSCCSMFVCRSVLQCKNCNTPQHTAPHKLTATHYSTLHRNAIHCNTPQALQHTLQVMTGKTVSLHDTAQSVLQGVAGCCRVLQCVAVCCSVLHLKLSAFYIIAEQTKSRCDAT